jgi:hypothetical protein
MTPCAYRHVRRCRGPRPQCPQFSPPVASADAQKCAAALREYTLHVLAACHASRRIDGVDRATRGRRGLAHPARERGLRAVFARELVEAVRILHLVPTVAGVVIPPSGPYDTCRVAATLRMQAPDVPVALVLGPGRLDDRARIMWPLTVPMIPVAREAIADIAAQACIDWVARTWDEAAPTLDSGLAANAQYRRRDGRRANRHVDRSTPSKMPGPRRSSTHATSASARSASTSNP